ncbi:MAG: hypothetical protein GY757_24225 [bacterium]|nr:hypothetical protein [bacterium]
MKDKDRIIKWINTMLQNVSNLENEKGIELLHACGGECSKSSVLLEGAVKTRNKYKKDVELQIVFEDFKKNYYNKPDYIMEGNKITLIFEECTCPMVKEGVTNPYLCNCTVGYSIKVLETLFNRPVKVKLLKSILNGDSICKQEALVEDA